MFGTLLALFLQVFCLVFGGIFTDLCGPDFRLLAKYDWQNGAQDVSGVAPIYNGVLDNGVTASNGVLTVPDLHGVNLGHMQELSGAKSAKFIFEDVTFDNSGSGVYCSFGYSVLLGSGENQWWLGVDRDIADHHNPKKTELVFNMGGETNEYEFKVPIANPFQTSFERIEYRFNGEAPTDKRFSIRYDGGGWVYGGTSNYDAFPVVTDIQHEYIQVNDGTRADWDYWCGTLGTLSIYVGEDE